MKARYPFFLTIVFVLGLAAPSQTVSSEGRYPDRPIQLVIPFVAGAIGDVTGRMLADDLEKIIGTKIVPLNKPGASTVLGTEAVIRGKKDGYTILYGGSSGFVYAPASNPEIVHFDRVNDVEPLGFHYFLPMTIGVKSDSPWKSLSQLLDYAKRNPGKLRVSTIGVGSTPHFVIEVLQSMTGAQFTHVPFEGGESVLTAVLGGHVEVTCDGFSKLKPQLEAGKMRVLLTTNKIPAFPDIPTIAELGYKQNLPTAWFALYATSGIPEEAKSVLIPAIEKAVRATKARIDQMGSIVEYKAPEDLRKMVDDEYKTAYEIAVKIGLRKP